MLLLCSHTQSEGSLADDTYGARARGLGVGERITLTAVDHLVLLEVCGPCSLSQSELVGKPQTEARQASRAGYSSAQVQH